MKSRVFLCLVFFIITNLSVLFLILLATNYKGLGGYFHIGFFLFFLFCNLFYGYRAKIFDVLKDDDENFRR